jgi:hypothetical protein
MRYQIVECLNTDINLDLFSKTNVSVAGDKHHGHPFIAGVTRNLYFDVSDHAVFSVAVNKIP